MFEKGAGVPRTRWPPAAALAAVLALALVLRLSFAAKMFVSTFDTATVGVMALHILDGARPLFYYGQDYMGALESYATAPALALWGVTPLSLCLAPILFALGWVYATWLLFHDLYGVRGGLAAALAVAVPGWDTLWYTLAPYGGYPEMFLFGTLFLWLALRLARAPGGPASQRRSLAVLGAVAALGLWTNLQVLSYLLAGSLLLLALAARRRSAAFLVPFLPAAALAALGLVPWLAVRAAWGPAATHVATLSLSNVEVSARALVTALQKFFLWPVAPPLPPPVLLAALAAAAVLFLRSLRDPVEVELRLGRLAVLAMLPIFLALYLPHAFARVPGPRYLIPPLMLLICAGFATAAARQARGWRAVLGWLPLAVWITYNSASAAALAAARAPEQEAVQGARERVVAGARGIGVRHVEILGAVLEGLAGQIFTLYAVDEVRFVSSLEERYQPAAQDADGDPDTALMFRGAHRERVVRSLAAAGVSCRTIEAPPWAMTHAHGLPRAHRRALPPEGCDARVASPAGSSVAGGELFDRDARTVVGGEGGAAPLAVTVHLEREALLDGVFVASEDGADLPSIYRIAVSTDGERFTEVAGDFHDLLPVTVQGERAYVGGYYPAQDLRFAPVRARAVRLQLSDPARWRVGEVRLMERLGEGAPVEDGEVEAIGATLRGRPVAFAAADRWLSARLLAAGAVGTDDPPVYPRRNPRHPPSLLSRRLAPRPGLAFVVAREFAEDAAALLRLPALHAYAADREDFPHYTVFVLEGRPAAGAPAPPDLFWNGHLLLLAGAPA